MIQEPLTSNYAFYYIYNLFITEHIVYVWLLDCMAHVLEIIYQRS